MLMLNLMQKTTTFVETNVGPNDTSIDDLYRNITCSKQLRNGYLELINQAYNLCRRFVSQWHDYDLGACYIYGMLHTPMYLSMSIATQMSVCKHSFKVNCMHSLVCMHADVDGRDSSETRIRERFPNGIEN